MTTFWTKWMRHKRYSTTVTKSVNRFSKSQRFRDKSIILVRPLSISTTWTLIDWLHCMMKRLNLGSSKQLWSKKFRRGEMTVSKHYQGNWKLASLSLRIAWSAKTKVVRHARSILKVQEITSISTRWEGSLGFLLSSLTSPTTCLICFSKNILSICGKLQWSHWKSHSKWPWS